MFQVGFGWNAVQAGTLLLWLFAGNLCMKPTTSWIMNRFGFRRTLLGNGLLVAVGFALCSLLQAHTPLPVIAVLLFFTGMTRSLQFTAYNTLGFADVPKENMRDATTLFSVLQQMNAGMGIALGALALSVASLLHGNDPGNASANDFRMAFGMIAVLALLGTIDSWMLPRNAGHGVLKKAPS